MLAGIRHGTNWRSTYSRGNISTPSGGRKKRAASLECDGCMLAWIFLTRLRCTTVRRLIHFAEFKLSAARHIVLLAHYVLHERLPCVGAVHLVKDSGLCCRRRLLQQWTLYSESE